MSSMVRVSLAADVEKAVACVAVGRCRSRAISMRASSDPQLLANTM